VDRLTGKVAVVTGGASGMGAIPCRRLVDEGARVVVADIDDAGGERVAADLGPSGRYVHLDVVRYDQWEAAVALAVSDFGGLDVLVNNAGVAYSARVQDYPLHQWDRVLAINLTGTFYGIRVAAPKMRRGGSIINVSSTAGLIGLQGMAAYNASKFGVRGLTKAAALDLGHLAIRVNSVHPGAIRTPMTAAQRIDQSRVALHRIGEPAEVAGLIVYLASDESSFSTGAEFIVDGGETVGSARLPDPVDAQL
jgi:3alpha(or 20beta)-hydroxysteroid dehydrogenase